MQNMWKFGLQRQRQVWREIAWRIERRRGGNNRLNGERERETDRRGVKPTGHWLLRQRRRRKEGREWYTAAAQGTHRLVGWLVADEEKPAEGETRCKHSSQTNYAVRTRRLNCGRMRLSANCRVEQICARVCQHCLHSRRTTLNMYVILQNRTNHHNIAESFAIIS